MRCKDKDLQTLTAFWGSDSPIGQMCQWDKLSYNEIQVLLPSERGARTESRRVTKNTVVSVTQRWEQHVYVARLKHFQSLLMKAVLRIRWARHRKFLIYDTAGLFRCLKWRILLGVLHQILRNISDWALVTQGTSPLLHREWSKLKALKKTNGIRKAALYARNKPAITRLYAAQLEKVLSRNNQATVMVESSDWADWANTDAGGVWWQTPRPPGHEAMQSLPRQMVELPFGKNCCHTCGVVVESGKCRTCGTCRCARYCSRHCQETHWPEHKKVCMKMLKRSNTFRLVQTTLQKKRDYPADATIEEAVYAMAVGCSAREDQHGR